MTRRALLFVLLLVVALPVHAGVSFHAGTASFEVGTGSFLHAFFSTVSANLEPKGWGTRFPVLMKQLYEGGVSAQNLGMLEKEVRTVQAELRKLPPSRIVWDIEKRSARPPWGDKISPDITDLSNYFVTSDGKDFFAVLFQAINSARKQNVPLKIE